MNEAYDTPISTLFTLSYKIIKYPNKFKTIIKGF